VTCVFLSSLLIPYCKFVLKYGIGDVRYKLIVKVEVLDEKLNFVATFLHLEPDPNRVKIHWLIFSILHEDTQN
jgi:hypothetical protein